MCVFSSRLLSCRDIRGQLRSAVAVPKPMPPCHRVSLRWIHVKSRNFHPCSPSMHMASDQVKKNIMTDKSHKNLINFYELLIRLRSYTFNRLECWERFRDDDKILLRQLARVDSKVFTPSDVQSTDWKVCKRSVLINPFALRTARLPTKSKPEVIRRKSRSNFISISTQHDFVAHFDANHAEPSKRANEFLNTFHAALIAFHIIFMQTRLKTQKHVHIFPFSELGITREYFLEKEKKKKFSAGSS